MIAEGSWNHVLRRMDLGLDTDRYHEDPMLFAREVLDA